MAYQAENIKSLDYFEHIRKYPGMYIGSKDAKGLMHCVKEIISNSIDEYLNGAGDTIQITFLPNNGIRIEDNGRGIPHGKHTTGCSILQACFGIANTGGKFDNATGESGYNTSGGEHGTGGKAVNALSRKMIVTTSRDGIKEIVEFAKGEFVSYNKISINKDVTGTSVEFYPDDEVLEVIEFDIPGIKTMIREFSFLCKGLRFVITEPGGATEEYISHNGLADYMEYLCKGQEMLISPLYFDVHEDKFQLEVAIGYTKSYSSITKLYTNNIPQEKGTHYTGFKTAWTSNLNAFARENKWLKEKETNLTGSDYDEGMVLILNFKMIDPVFKGQNKEELSSSEGRTYTQKLTTMALKELLPSRIKDIKIIIEKALDARKAREAAKKAKEAIRQPKEKGLKAKLALSKKFTDCESKNPKERNLLLVEGNSAAASAIEARNTKTDCIYMLRGKVVSPLKTDIAKILQNQEMSDIIRVIGAGFGKEFDVNKMNFNKIVITSDQDSDGADIELLLLTFFYTYMRPLVEAGKLYRAVTPLYIIRQKDKEYYCYSETELAQWKESHTGSYDLLRAKGLGELNPADLHRVCFLNERYKRITISDAQKATELLEILQGPSVEPRKKYIYENATALGFEFD